MKIQFYKPCWVIISDNEGFAGDSSVRAAYIEDTPFSVIRVDRDKKTQCSQIYVWNDGSLDGRRVYLINVPNGLFKQVNE